jgi:Domain of unknown function (DUF4279)
VGEKRLVEAAMRICSSKRSAAEIASLLPLKASRLVERGSRLNGGTAKDSRWILDSPLSENASIEDHITYFVNLLEGDGVRLQDIVGDYETDIWCTVSSTGEFTGISLDRALLKQVAAKNLELVFSVYADPATEPRTTERRAKKKRKR